MDGQHSSKNDAVPCHGTHGVCAWIKTGTCVTNVGTLSRQVICKASHEDSQFGKNEMCDRQITCSATAAAQGRPSFPPRRQQSALGAAHAMLAVGSCWLLPAPLEEGAPAHVHWETAPACCAPGCCSVVAAGRLAVR